MKSLFLLLCSAYAASAISFSVGETGTNTWSYDLTFDPRDIITSISGAVDTNVLQVGVSLDLFPQPVGRSLTIIGPPGHNCRLQVTDSTPATNWTDFFSFTLVTQVTNVIDLTATSTSVRFYRVVSS